MRSSSPSQSSVSTTAAGMSSGVGDLYNRLGSAIAERGYVWLHGEVWIRMLTLCIREMLGDLQQSLDNLGQESKNMVAQVRSTCSTIAYG